MINAELLVTVTGLPMEAVTPMRRVSSVNCTLPTAAAGTVTTSEVIFRYTNFTPGRCALQVNKCRPTSDPGIATNPTTDGKLQIGAVGRNLKSDRIFMGPVRAVMTIFGNLDPVRLLSVLLSIRFDAKMESVTSWV